MGLISLYIGKHWNYVLRLRVKLFVVFFLSLMMILNILIVTKAAPIGSCLSIANVDQWDFLYIRKNPDHKSSKVGAIAPNTSSPIVVTGRCVPNTKNLKRLWCPIEYFITKSERRNGYIKMYYTVQVQCPPSLEFYRQQ